MTFEYIEFFCQVKHINEKVNICICCALSDRSCYGKFSQKLQSRVNLHLVTDPSKYIVIFFRLCGLIFYTVYLPSFAHCMNVKEKVGPLVLTFLFITQDCSLIHLKLQAAEYPQNMVIVACMMLLLLNIHAVTFDEL
jgi:hypothetical protein